MAVFDAKTGLQQLPWQPKLQTFFGFMRVEAKKFLKTVFGARARQKKYCRFNKPNRLPR